MSLSNDKALKSVAEAVNKIMEAEKKAKMDYDKDGKVESPKDEVWGSRLRAAKMAGKLKEEEELDEASYSAKAARAGKDIGKPGKNFAKIAKKAGEKYGSAEAGKRVAGAILAKMRKEETEEQIDEAFPTVADAKKRMDAGKTATGTVTKTKTGLVHKRDFEHNAEDDEHPEKVGRPRSYGARQNYKRSTRVNESLSFTDMLELYNEQGLKVLKPIESEQIEVEGTTIEVIDADKINGYVETVVEEADTEEFTKDLNTNKKKAAGTAKQPDLAKGDTQAVKNEEVEPLNEMSAPDRLKDYHNETAKLMKGIHSALSDHYKRHEKNAHWGHVGDVRHIHDQLRDIHDRLHEQGEYAKASQMRKEQVEKLDEVAPPGREKQVKALKKVPGISNPWAVSWASYRKSHPKKKD